VNAVYAKVWSHVHAPAFFRALPGESYYHGGNRTACGYAVAGWLIGVRADPGAVNWHELQRRGVVSCPDCRHLLDVYVRMSQDRSDHLLDVVVRDCAADPASSPTSSAAA
jgi:hypothetical protein